MSQYIKQYVKKKSFRILLIIEAVLLLIGVAGLFGKDAVYEYGLSDMRANFGEYSEVEGGYTEAGADGAPGNLVDFCELSLPKGVYAVSLHYKTDTNMVNMCQITDDTLPYNTMLTNGEHLYAGLNHTDFNMWLLRDASHLIVHAYYGGEGSLTVTGLTISETNALNRMFLFWAVVGILLVNVCYFYVQYDRQFLISVKDKTVTFCLLLIILLASVPLFVDYMSSGGDLGYHLMRIEGIKDGILTGQFPVRIAPEWQQGYGYASSIFYGETLLYIAAFFRLIGFTVTTSYRMFFFLETVGTVLIAYYSFNRIFKEKYIGVLCSALYSLSVYRMYKTYTCGSFGESFGVMFLPLLVYGFYRVFTQDIHDRTYKKSWLPLTIGYSGLIQSHLLSGELAGAFTILLCLILWKKVFRKETFLVLAKTVIYSCLLSAWFLVPFADYMLTGNFVIQNVSARNIQYRGLYLAHLLLAFPRNGGNVFYDERGMYDSHATNLGFPYVMVLILWAGLLFFRKTAEMKKEEKKLGQIAAAFSILAMVMSLSVFPWDSIQSLGGIAATLVSSLQFPNRFLTIATVLLTALAGVVAKWCMEHGKILTAGVYFCGMLSLVIISDLYVMNDLYDRVQPVRLYNGEGMGTGYISGAEYLPYGADVEEFVHRAPEGTDGVLIEAYEKRGLTIDMNCKNTVAKEGSISMPLLYYKGYVAYDVDSGDEFAVSAGDDFLVKVGVPEGYEGNIRVTFQGPWYWRVAEAVNLVFFLGLCISGIIWRKGGKGR